MTEQNVPEEEVLPADPATETDPDPVMPDKPSGIPFPSTPAPEAPEPAPDLPNNNPIPPEPSEEDTLRATFDEAAAKRE
jgi:hypothetical protein